MAWAHLTACIIREFRDAQDLVEQRVATEEGGLEALRRGWRERQATRGLCRSCRTPADNDSKYCAKHRAQNAERARAAYARRKAA